MWNYIKGCKPPTPKISKNTSNSSKPSTSASNKEYEKKRKREFQAKWEVGRPWLKNTDLGMVCDWCTEFEKTLVSQNCLNSKIFITGCKSYNSESIAYHKKSLAHEVTTSCFKAKSKPATTPAYLAVKQLNTQHSDKLRILFRNAHAVVKNRRPFRDYSWLCDLDEAKGICPGNTYRNEAACRTFTRYIAKNTKSEVVNDLKKVKFLSVTSDGATDASITEQEIVFIRYSHKGKVRTRFVSIKNPVSPDAKGIYNSIIDALQDIGLDPDKLGIKLIGFGCDGASVMLGKKGGVAVYFQRIAPHIIIIHCYAHRLELAYKDSIKKNSLYDSCIVLLMGLYYFNHNSPKQRQNLKRSYESLGEKILIPTRVGGTRWVGHIVLAADILLKGYKALRSQIEDCITQKTKGEAQNKARGYIRLMKRPDIIAFLHLLLDILRPLRQLSLTLQSNETTLAEVADSIQVAKDVLSNYSESDGPKLRMYYRETTDTTFRNEVMSGKISDNFRNNRTTLCNAILVNFEKRFADISEGVVAATQIASFKYWPSCEAKEQIKVFGDEELETLCKHFAHVLDRAEVDTDKAVCEWDTLKLHLYGRYKEKLKSLSWEEVFEIYESSHVNILAIIDLIRSLPASSSENERGFSCMKLIKTSTRSRMTTNTLGDLMTVKLSSPPIKEFDPDPAIQDWINDSKRARRPTFRDCNPVKIKKARLDLHQDQIVNDADLIEHFDSTDEEEEVNFIQQDAANNVEECSSDFDEGFASDYDDNELNEDEVVEKLMMLTKN